MENSVIFLALAACYFMVLASVDGDGHHHIISVPGGKKGDKWTFKAKGKGMQNLMMHSGGGEYKKEYENKEYEHKEYEHKPQVVFVPVPIHHEYKKGEGYKKEYEHKGYEYKPEMVYHPIPVHQEYKKEGGKYKKEYEHKEYEHKEYEHKPQMYHSMPMHQEYKKDEYHGHGSNLRGMSLMPGYGSHGQFGEFSDNYRGYGGYGPDYFGGHSEEYDHYGGGHQ